MINIINNDTIEDLTNCNNEKEIEDIFNKYNIVNINEKIEYLLLSLNSDSIHPFNKNTPPEIVYNDLIKIFLDEDVRLYKGL